MGNGRLACACIGLILYLSLHVLAVESGALIREQQPREQQQRERLQERPDVFLPEAGRERPVETEEEQAGGPCFNIEQIHIEGAPSAWLAWLEQPAPVSLPECMHAGDIKAVVNSLSNRILARGYVTSRIDVPEQNLHEGVLRLNVQPGFVSAIRGKNEETDWALRSAFPVRAGDILNIRDLEQGLEQLARPMTQQAQLEIVPGEEWGTSDIVVLRERQFPLSVGLSLDNSGQPATGRRQLGGYLVWDRPLQLNDVLILSYNRDGGRLQSPGSRANTLAYTLPWGNWTWGLTFSRFHYRQQLMGLFSPFASSGYTQSWNVALTRLLQRSQVSKSEVDIQLMQKKQHSYINDEEILAQRRRLTIAAVNLRHRHYVGRLMLDAQIGVQKGVRWLHAEKESRHGQDAPTARHRLYSGRLSAMLPFELGKTAWRWSSEWRWQYSPDMLFGSEQLSIGSHYTVRGFQTGLAGNSGHYWRNELAWNVLPANQRGRMLDLYMGVDAGRISKTSYPLAGKTLSGWTVGLRGAVSRHAYAELSLAGPIHASRGLARERVVYFKVGFSG